MVFRDVDVNRMNVIQSASTKRLIAASIYYSSYLFGIALTLQRGSFSPDKNIKSNKLTFTFSFNHSLIQNIRTII